MHHHQHGARLDDTGKTAAIGTDVLDSNTHDRLARVIAWREDAFNERDERARLRAICQDMAISRYEAIREERRLCFVGVCRAEDSLTFTRIKEFGGYSKSPSPFLRELGVEEIEG